jgi:hypothetical protein
MNVVTGGHPNSTIIYFHTVSNNLGNVQTHEVEVKLHTIGIIVTEVGKNRIYYYYYYLHCCRLMQNHCNYMW